MAKIYGLFGSMTGKVADVVMAVRNGEQIARKYQPVVTNPSTPAQVATRARLKLMSQLSAVMAPVIAIPRRGSVSSRNIFVKKNYGTSTYDNDAASIALLDVKITDSVVSLPGLTTTRQTSSLSVSLLGTTGTDINRVVYAMFEKQSDNTLRYVGSKVISVAGAQNTFEAAFELNSASSDVVIYAYGVRDNTAAARAVFGNLTVLSATSVANLIVSRTLTMTDVTLTETKSVESAPTSMNQV